MNPYLILGMLLAIIFFLVLIIVYFNKWRKIAAVGTGLLIILSGMGIMLNGPPAEIAAISSYEWDAEEGWVLNRDAFLRLNDSDYYVTCAAGDTGSDADGFLRVINISGDGTIVASLVDSWEYDTSYGMVAGIKHISGDIYAVYYCDTSNGVIFTTTIWSTNGTLKEDIISSRTYTIPRGQHLIHVNGDIYALSYQEVAGGYDHFLETYKIWSNNGTISARIDVVEYDQDTINNAYEYTPSVVLVDTDTVAVAYGTSTPNGKLVTYNISSVGDITNTNASYWTFDTTRGGFPHIMKIDGNVFAMAFEDNADDGWINTLTIANNGTITKSWIDTLEFDGSACTYPAIFTVMGPSAAGGVYGISYRGVDNDGFVCSVNITSAGSESAAIIDVLEFETTYNKYFSVPVYVDGSIFAICYTGDGDDGWVVTVDIALVREPATFYVSTTGNDITGDGSIGNPYKTLQKALNVSGAGEIIYLRGGNYNTMYYSTTGYRITKTGTVAAPFTIASYPGERAVIDGSGYTLGSGMALFLMYYGSSYSNNVTIRDLTFANSSQNGIRAAGGSSNAVKDLKILNCSFVNMYYRAILLQTTLVSTGGHIETVSVENCTFYNLQTSYSSGEGITFIGVEDFRFCNNTVEFCRKIHLDISGGCINGDVYNNVFHLNDSYSGEAIYIDPYGHNNDKVSFINIYNNMIWGVRVGASAKGANAIAICGEVSGDSVDNVSIYNNVINISCPDISTPGSILWNGISSKYNYQAIGNKLDNITVKFNTVYIQQGSGYPFFTNVLRENIKNVVIANNIFMTNETRLTTFQIWVTDCNITDGNIEMYNNLYNHTTKHANKGKWIANQNVSEATAVISSPLFVDIDSGDFHLTAAASPAIDAANATYTVSTDYDGVSRPQGSGYDIGAYECEETTSYTDTIRNDGTDYFVWLGVNTTAYWVNTTITGMNEATESISIWNRTAWSGSLWQRYNGTRTGVNWTVHTFDIIRTKLDDAAGSQVITMAANPDMDYDASQAIPLINLTNKGYNYSAYNRIAATTLQTINTTAIGLPSGDTVAKWNRTTYAWDIWISGFGPHDHNVSRWDVIQTKVSGAETWNT